MPAASPDDNAVNAAIDAANQGGAAAQAAQAQGLPAVGPDCVEETHGDAMDNVVPTYAYQQLPVVGLGGSAGGIQALKAFFAALPPETGTAYVVILHLSPEHDSTLPALLQGVTPLPVKAVQDGERLLPDHVYVIPPGRQLTVTNGHLRLSPLESERGRRVVVDLFFRSLADAHGPRATAVVLSGADGDGAIGIKRIKERGGLTVAQEPSEAEHEGMPRSSIATGMVDWVLHVADMPARILDYSAREHHLRLPPEDGPQPAKPAGPPQDEAEANLREVLAFLRGRTGNDFTYYKRATILRRIARRMQVNGVSALPEYLHTLRTHAGEVAALFLRLRPGRAVHPDRPRGRVPLGHRRRRERGADRALLHQGAARLPGAARTARNRALRRARPAQGRPVLAAGPGELPQPADLPGARRADPRAGNLPLRPQAGRAALSRLGGVGGRGSRSFRPAGQEASAVRAPPHGARRDARAHRHGHPAARPAGAVPGSSGAAEPGVQPGRRRRLCPAPILSPSEERAALADLHFRLIERYAPPSVNLQLRHNVEELGQANSDLHNLMNATSIATVFLDRELRVMRYTPEAVAIFHLIPSDTGRPLADLKQRVDYPGMDEDARRVLRTLVPVEREVGDAGGGDWFLARRSPYRSLEERIEGVVLTFVDITERKRAQEVALAAERQFRSFVEASSDTVYTMSADWAEMRFLEGKQFLADTEHPSRTWLETYIPPADQPQVLAAIQEAIRRKVPFELEHQIIRADGTLGWTFSRAIPMLDARGEISEWIGAASDVTERKRAEEARRVSEEKYRSLFSSMDQGYCIIQMLYDADGQPADFRYMEVNPAFEKHNGLTNATGKTIRELAPDIEGKWVEIYGRVAASGESVRRVESSSALDGRTFDLYAFRVAVVLEGPACPFHGDFARLQQVFWNLLKNASKFTPPGGAIEIRSRCREGELLVVEMIDTGIGLEADAIERIFQPFEQGSASITREFGGLGLGLAIAKATVEAHGGTLRVRSAGPGQGATFTVSLPLTATGERTT